MKTVVVATLGALALTCAAGCVAAPPSTPTQAVAPSAAENAAKATTDTVVWVASTTDPDSRAMVSHGIGDGSSKPPLPAELISLPHVYTDTMDRGPHHLAAVVITDPGYIATCTITINNVTVARDDEVGTAQCDWQT